ncbi:unnamed protein product [Ilex paraguariensis]|uniref:Uncharacterized protein n=1 Tax=Ilex paraguariensis TaxID=185542 RepID=A0ABC8SIC4_9AQUA
MNLRTLFTKKKVHRSIELEAPHLQLFCYVWLCGFRRVGFTAQRTDEIAVKRAASVEGLKLERGTKRTERHVEQRDQAEANAELSA